MFNGERIMSKECIACGKKQLDKDTVGITNIYKAIASLLN